MKKTAFLSDIIFTFFLVWIVTLCLFRHLKISLTSSLILSALCALLSACAHAMLLQSKQKTLLLKRSDAVLKEKLSTHLALLGDEEKTKLFSLALSALENANVKRVGKLRLESEAYLYFLCFRFAPVTTDDVARYSRYQTKKQKTIVCEQIEQSALELCKRLHIEVRAGDFAFGLLRLQNALPENYLCDEPKKEKHKRRLKLCFARSNAKRFLTSASLILLLSLITPFPFYYLLFGGVLIALAIVIRIFGYV